MKPASNPISLKVKIALKFRLFNVNLLEWISPSGKFLPTAFMPTIPQKRYQVVRWQAIQRRIAVDQSAGCF
jgi:hypothetical protein